MTATRLRRLALREGLDRSRQRLAQDAVRGGREVTVVLEAEGPAQALGQPGDLDTLYTFVSQGSRLRPVPVPSRLDDAPCAFRYSGSDEHGRVMVFTFPVYWWADSAADSLGQRAIAWFWDEVEPGEGEAR